MRWYLLLFLMVLSLGFRLGWKNTMDADAANPEIYVQFCPDNQTKLFAQNTVSAPDPLAKMVNVTAQEVLDSILDDYNGIVGSLLRLKNIADGPAEIPANKIINICQGSTQALGASAQAKPLPQGGCTITLGSGVFKDVKLFLGALTHEIGHCLGLDHAHEMNQLAIMSYFAPPEIYRLQADDKLGIIHLYPLEKLKYQNTWGLSCVD